MHPYSNLRSFILVGVGRDGNGSYSVRTTFRTRVLRLLWRDVPSSADNAFETSRRRSSGAGWEGGVKKSPPPAPPDEDFNLVVGEPFYRKTRPWTLYTRQRVNRRCQILAPPSLSFYWKVPGKELRISKRPIRNSG